MVAVERNATPDALTLHHELVVFDCLSLEYILDPPYSERALEGGVSATNVTVASEGESWEQVLRNIASAQARIHRNPDLLLATSAADVLAAKAAGRIAVILGTQGSGPVGDDLTRVATLAELGLRYIGLAYTGATLLADGCGETRNAGLSFLGRDFIQAVNETSMLLDLSHTGHRSRLEAAELADHPVCTHSNAYAVNPNDRNTADDAALIIASKGGVMGVTGLVKSVAPENPTIEHMLDHADHWVQLIGANHTGIGLDLTEGYQERQSAGTNTFRPPKWRVLRPDIFGTVEDFFSASYPKGLESITKLPNFTAGLLARGYDRDAVSQIIGGSWLRNLEDAEHPALSA